MTGVQRFKFKKQNERINLEKADSLVLFRRFTL